MWEQTEHGFEREDEANHISLWILPRPGYCDRGHYQWGQNGLSEELAPSYYFMSPVNAQIEIDEWVEEQVQKNNSDDTPQIRRELDQKALVKSGWLPHPERKTAYIKMVLDDKDEPHTVTLDMLSSGANNVFVFNAQNLPGIDFSDQFPRLYRNQGVAQEEAEAFLNWRLNKIPHVATPIKKLAF